MTKAVRAKFPTSFGVFSPTGHIVMVFDNEARAAEAAAALKAGGFSSEDLTQYTAAEVIAESQRSMAEAASPVQIGQEVAKVEEYRALAEDGCGFLIVHAPEDEKTKLAMSIVKPFHVRFAEKYNRLTLEELA